MVTYPCACGAPGHAVDATDGCRWFCPAHAPAGDYRIGEVQGDREEGGQWVQCLLGPCLPSDPHQQKGERTFIPVLGDTGEGHWDKLVGFNTD